LNGPIHLVRACVAKRCKRTLKPAAVLVGLACAASVLFAPSASDGAPLPAGSRPSSIAREVCQPKAQNLIQDAIGEAANVSTPTWTDHLYACNYRYAAGTMVLSVRELSSWRQTLDYFNRLGTALHKKNSIYQLGQGAFQVRNGSVVVRKDWKVLLVNVAALPREFGSPPAPTLNLALSVAGIIMECWHGD
jgi:hypothetical protein